MIDWKGNMKIAIIDDEQHWRCSAKQIVSKYYSNVEVSIDVYEDGEQYLNSKVNYDISFVDIEMPGVDGFTTIENARKYNPDGIFIILTTHTEMSRKGYLVNAFRYIDKIKLVDEMIEAMKSAEILLGRNKKIEINITDVGIRKLVLKDILYIETEKHRTLVHTNEKMIKCNNTMREMESILDASWFFRCHNSYIVNLDEISRIDKKIIYLKNGDSIDIAQRKAPEFNKAYLKRQFECGNG